MPAIAGVDDAHIGVLGNHVGRPRAAVADDADLGADGLEGAGGIDEGFALLDAGIDSAEVDDVGAQGLGRQLEGGTSAGAGLVEHGDDGAATQAGHPRHLPPQHLLHGVRRRQDGLDFVTAEIVEVEDVAAPPRRPRL